MSIFSFLKRGRGHSTTQIRMEEASQIREMQILKSIPLFGQLDFKTQKKFLSVAISALAIGTFGAGVLGSQMSEWSLKRAQLATQLELYSQRLPVLTEAAVKGDKAAFVLLQETIDSVLKNQEVLQNGEGLMPGTTNEEALVVLNRFVDSRPVTLTSVKTILDSQNEILEATEVARNIELSTATTFDLVEKTRLAQAQTTGINFHTMLLTTMTMNLKDLESLAGQLRAGTSLPEDIEGSMTRARQGIQQLMNILQKGNEEAGVKPVDHPNVKKRLDELNVLLGATLRDVDRAARLIQKVAQARKASSIVHNHSEMSLKVAGDLSNQYTQFDAKTAEMLIYTAALLLVLTILLGFLRAWVTLVETKHQAATIEESIMYLMNDLTMIAEGDLRVRARITEDITGAIADSINYTVSALNTTIHDVRESATNVTSRASEIQDKAFKVRDLVMKQAEQIETAANSVLSMTESIQRVALDTDESSRVANESMEAAAQGRKAVLDAIQGMEQIRTQIQETSKRIKRLGEANQEVGEIVTLISDMTEQTNVLALNASIQAAAAGEAGRGFRAVATEVQRLAERSEAALKRIVALIQTAQSETQNTIAAMERSTQQVVEGAQVTNRAGEALSRIEEVASQLNDLMEMIHETTQAQTMDAGVVSGRIAEVLKIAEQTVEDMSETSNTVETINEVAEQLQSSVSNFKLN